MDKPVAGSKCRVVPSGDHVQYFVDKYGSADLICEVEGSDVRSLGKPWNESCGGFLVRDFAVRIYKHNLTIERDVYCVKIQLDRGSWSRELVFGSEIELVADGKTRYIVYSGSEDAYASESRTLAERHRDYLNRERYPTVYSIRQEN